MDWIKIICHCGEELEVFTATNTSLPCPQCGCGYALDVNDNRMRYKIGNNLECENPTVHDTKDIYKEYYHHLLVSAIVCSYKNEWYKTTEICKKLLNINKLSQADEISCRKLYSKSLLVLSFKDNANTQNLREESIKQAEIAIELFTNALDSSILSELYDALGDSLCCYGAAIKGDKYKANKYFLDGIKSFEKAISINPENEDALKHLESAKSSLK